ncbi:MAG: FkbM family methyltransferase [Deltaproteobacteria bacterium]|nr:FkbM family methyltransferase [Deltaproteobacteria bacterium]
MQHEYALIHHQDCRFLIRKDERGIFDRRTIVEVFDDNTYKFPIQPFFTIIDVGAFIGAFTVYSAQKAQRVIACEPNPESFALLKQNVFLNELNNVDLIPAAVGGSREPRTLTIDRQSPNQGGANIFGHRSLTGEITETSFADGVAHDEISVPTITMEDIFKRFEIAICDLLKMDCEGAEYEIIFQMPEDTLRKIDRIAIEYHNFIFDEAVFFDLGQFLKNNGFFVIHGDHYGQHGMLFAIRRNFTIEHLSVFQEQHQLLLDVAGEGLKATLSKREAEMHELRELYEKLHLELQEIQQRKDIEIQRKDREIEAMLSSMRWKYADYLYKFTPNSLIRFIKKCMGFHR